ncbi:MAG: phosphatidate cytidylyltransferase [Gemmatimonadota bacterium]
MTADRGLGRRLATAAVLLPLFVATIVVGRLLFLGAVIVLTAVGIVEFYGLARDKPYRPRPVSGVALGAMIPVLLYWMPGDPLAMATLMTVGVAGIATAQMLDTGGEETIASVAFTLLGSLYVGFLFGHMVLVREMAREMPREPYWAGAALLGIPLVLTWVNDTVAYFAGRRWGRRRLLERVSPGKSWMGAVVAFAATLTVAVLALPWLDRGLGFFEPADALALGALVGLVAPLGDLVESAFKRDAGVKDSSQLVPGHGGVLDRFDSALFTVPVFYHYLRGWVL